MYKFAKLFDSDKYGQILVKVDSSEDGRPEIRVYFTPEDLGVCSVAVIFKDSKEGWKSSKKLFARIDKECSEKLISDIDKDLPR